MIKAVGQTMDATEHWTQELAKQRDKGSVVTHSCQLFIIYLRNQCANPLTYGLRLDLGVSLFELTT